MSQLGFLAERVGFELSVPSFAWTAHSHCFAVYGWSCDDRRWDVWWCGLARAGQAASRG